MAVMKEIGSKWLVDAADYISNNPQFIVNGFVRAGITYPIVMLTPQVKNLMVMTMRKTMLLLTT